MGFNSLNYDERTLQELGEGWILKYIIPRLSRIESSPLKPGDDAVAFKDGKMYVCCSDMLVAETDVPPGMSLKQAGSKAIVSVISDLAAKGAKPLYIFIDLALPRSMRAREFKELWAGFEEACSRYGASIVGGDTNEAGELVVGVYGIGSATRVLSRRGARPGDVVTVTGTFGKSYAGLHSLLHEVRGPAWEELRESVLSPIARLDEGIAIASTGLASAAIDSSDGLASSLIQLGDASGVGFRITDPPIDPLAARYAEENGLDLFEAVIHGGEEYELVIVVPQAALSKIKEVVSKVGGKLITIGRVTEERVIVVEWEGEERYVERGGWEHFRSSKP